MKRNLTVTEKKVLAAAVSATLAAAPLMPSIALADDVTSTRLSDDSSGSSGQNNPPVTGGDTTTGGGSGKGSTETTVAGIGDTTTGQGSTETTVASVTGTGDNTGSSSSSSGSGSQSSTSGSKSTNTTDTSSYSGYYSSSSSSSSDSSSSSSTTTTTTTKKSSNWTRLGGADRYETMSQIVSKGWSKSDWAVLAVGVAFPDALTASSLAGTRDCPVLLTDGSTLSPQAQAQITNLGVKDIYLVGGEGAISAAVANQISQLGVTVHRVAGADRVDTSVQALKEARAAGSVSDCVIIATGDNFADALSIGPWSYQSKSPIILVRGGTLNAQAIDAIRSDPQIKRIIIVGGESAVSESVKDQLDNAYEFERLSGANRYETSAAIADWCLSHGLKTANALVATGNNFPDALAGAALGGKLGGVMLLEDGSGCASRWLTGKGVSGSPGFVLGGASAVSDSVMAGLK